MSGGGLVLLISQRSGAKTVPQGSLAAISLRKINTGPELVDRDKGSRHRIMMKVTQHEAAGGGGFLGLNGFSMVGQLGET